MSLCYVHTNAFPIHKTCAFSLSNSYSSLWRHQQKDTLQYSVNSPLTHSSQGLEGESELVVTSTFLYACESWTLTAELQRRIQAMEMRCYCKILHISHKDHATNEEVCAKIHQATGPHAGLVTIVKRCKRKWYGHVSHSSGLAKTILQGSLKGGRRRGKQKKRWEDNIKEQTGLEFTKSQRAVENRKMEETGCEVICGAQTTSTVKWRLSRQNTIRISKVVVDKTWFGFQRL